MPIEQFQMPRTIWLPAGMPADAAAFYVGVLKKVSETPEWKEYVTRTSQSTRFLTGEAFARRTIEEGQSPASRDIFQAEGWLIN